MLLPLSPISLRLAKILLSLHQDFLLQRRNFFLLLSFFSFLFFLSFDDWLNERKKINNSLFFSIFVFLFLIFFPANSFRAKKSNCFSSPWFDAEGFFRSLIIFALQPHSSKNLFVAPACHKPVLDGFDYQLLPSVHCSKQCGQ